MKPSTLPNLLTTFLEPIRRASLNALPISPILGSVDDILVSGFLKISNPFSHHLPSAFIWLAESEKKPESDR